MNKQELIEYRKSEIKNLKYYNNVIDDFSKKIEAIDIKLYDVQAVDTTKTITKGQGFDRYKFEDKKKMLLQEKNIFVKRVEDIMKFLNQLEEEDKLILIQLYFKNQTWLNVAIEHNMSERKLARHINKILSVSVD